MKNWLVCGALILGCLSFSQEGERANSYFDLNYFRGNIALHNNDILHLITGHPEGAILSWNKKTFGEKPWHERFNYPDYGGSLIYQDLKNEVLGTTFGLYAHYNFYFFKRQIMLRMGQGLAHTSNPYDKFSNPKNTAFGSHFMSSTYIMLNYKKERLFNRFGLQAGFTLIHYSNANVKAPNGSINTITFNLGVNYNIDETSGEFIKSPEKEKFTEPIKYNLIFRTGINESDLIGSGQFPFYIVSAYADKRLSHVSAIQFGAEVFFSNFLKEFIKYKSVAFPDGDVKGDEDYKRVGIFVGYELFINRTSLITQLGYYLYYPFEFENRMYIRLGVKRYFGKKVFAVVSLKSHGFRAEAVELGAGIRL